MPTQRLFVASILTLALLLPAGRLSAEGSGAGAGDLGAPAEGPLEATYETYGALLARYVTPTGVRYAEWRAKPADVKALSGVVARLSTADLKSLSPADRFALYINLYNAKVLEIVLAENPKTSIKEVNPGLTGFGVFLKDVLQIGKDKISLRQLEDRLREESKDPRVHFAINCASRSCPPIAAEPYRGDKLNDQLDHSTRSFLASPGALLLHLENGPGGKETVVVEASKIFDWYEKDFKAAGGPLAFIQKYGPVAASDALKRAGSSAKIKHQDYDWSLNAAS